MPGDALLDGLDPDQLAAVTTDAAPLAIIAGAGSGKTRVVTRRIAHRIATGRADPRRVLALTFTRRAAGELVSRLRSLGVAADLTAGTFHAVAYAQLRRRWADQGRLPKSVVSSRRRLIWAVVDDQGQGAVADLTAALDWAGPRGLTAADYPEAAAAAGRWGDHERTAALLAAYDLEKRKRGVVDLDDLLRLCAEALEEDADFAEAQQWRFRHLHVDEFQDVNPLQFRLLRAWLGDRDDLCVVGDPRQAIYGWNGADPSLLDRFAFLFPGATITHLDHNHRSTPEVVATATAVLGGSRTVVTTTPGGPKPTVTAYPDPDHEAAGIAARLRRAHQQGVAWRRQAVLTRTNAQLDVLEATLAGAGVPVERHRPDADVEAGLDGNDPAGAPVALDEGDGDGAVTLTTFHRAKGLEWEVVCVAGLEDGYVPIARAATPDARDEERRLLHVALSRAERVLHCSWAEARSFGERMVTRDPSPWLAPLGALTEASAPPTLDRADTKEKIASLRRMLRPRP